MGERFPVPENARPSAQVCHPLHVWPLILLCCTHIESNIFLRHCMVYHVPTMLKKYGNLKQFSGQGTLQFTLCVRYMYATLFTYCVQVLKKITMTPSATTSQAISTMHLEKSSKVSVGKRHYGRVCGITPLVFDKREVTLNVTKITGPEVAFRKSESVPKEIIQPRYLDIPSCSSLSTLYMLTSTSFFQSYPIYKRFHLSHILVI